MQKDRFCQQKQPYESQAHNIPFWSYESKGVNKQLSLGRSAVPGAKPYQAVQPMPKQTKTKKGPYIPSWEVITSTKIWVNSLETNPRKPAPKLLKEDNEKAERGLQL